MGFSCPFDFGFPFGLFKLLLVSKANRPPPPPSVDVLFVLLGRFLLGPVFRKAANIPGITSITWTWGWLLALIGWQLGVAGGGLGLI